MARPSETGSRPAGQAPSGLDASRFDPARGCCDACPFSDTEASIQAQNWGCLPIPAEVFAIKQETGCNWGCHSRDGICAGYVNACREYGLEYRDAPTLDHATWYQHGQEVAAISARLQHAIVAGARSGETGTGSIRRTPERPARSDGIAQTPSFSTPITDHGKD